MSNENKSGHKTEKPTPKRLRDARKKGQIAKSKEVVAAFLTLALVIYLLSALDFMTERLGALMMAPMQAMAFGMPRAYIVLGDAAVEVLLWIVLPVLALVVSVAVFGNVVQFGMLYSAETVKPRMDKLNPITQLKNILSLRSLLELFKSIVKILVLGGCCAYFVRENLSDMLLAPTCGLHCVGAVFLRILYGLLGATIAAYLVLAIVDYAFQKYDFTKKMMMTKDEVKREYKEVEGDPLIKSKRRELHRELLASAGDLDIRNSSAVIANPTHYAVALHYQRGVTPLPIVTARGRGKEALRIRRVAEQYGVPVIENPPLARKLYRKDRVGDYISRELMAEVAQMLRRVRVNFGTEPLERRPAYRLGPLLSPLNQLFDRLHR